MPFTSISFNSNPHFSMNSNYSIFQPIQKDKTKPFRIWHHNQVKEGQTSFPGQPLYHDPVSETQQKKGGKTMFLGHIDTVATYTSEGGRC